MGGACLRGHGHHWPAGRSGGAAARGWRQGHLADEPDPPRAHARPQLLRAGGDPDAIHHGHAQGQRDAVSNPNAVAVRVGVALGDRGDQRLGESVPFADRDGHAVTDARQQPEGLELALAELP